MADIEDMAATAGGDAVDQLQDQPAVGLVQPKAGFVENQYQW